ncbi:hypothetical protein CYMTET_3430 [Cymbomonas tetramitiformis]|uniref:Endonuclease/exonuclease/phosphatase domain-containing protein n=1 Tax=Cymbomonas tetramitiformis TaxID=36881 RepID=A0AAE0H3D5_9CHLO|nr:hypothetical protein CYMTET_3430 [Cymbomonas tetramitiformis]
MYSSEGVKTTEKETVAAHEEAPDTRPNQKERVKVKNTRKEAVAPQRPSHIGGGTHSARGTEGQYPRNSVTQGIFKEDGKLNMYQVDLALEELEEHPPGSTTIQEVLRLLKENDGRFLEMIRKKVAKGGGTQIPVIGNGHWLLLMIGVCGTGDNRTLQAYVYDSMGAEKQTRRRTALKQMGMTEELQTAISGWVKDNKEVMGCQESRATLMYDKHQYDAYNCGVWVVYITELWQRWLRERNGAWVQQVYTNTLQTSRCAMLHTAEIAKRCRDKFRPKMRAAIMRENALHTAQDTKEVEVVREVEAKKTGVQKEQARGTCAADAFMREMTRDYTRERVENTMRQQGVGIQVLMEVGEALQALQEDNDTLISETMEKLRTDGSTQIAIRDKEKWGMMMLTVTHQDIQSNVCTSVPRGEGEAGEDNHTAGLAVILTGEYAKPHNYTEVKVPHLQGVLTHTLLHFPGEKYPHLIGVYYPVEGKDAGAETRQGEFDRELARSGIQEYVRMVTSASEKAAGHAVLVCGDLNATTGKPRNSRDRDWNRVLDATGLQDVGGTRETTLTWHRQRNIDRMLASKAEMRHYKQPTEGELTELHTSDHKMVCTTQLDLKAWGTHRPTAQKQQNAKADRPRLPLTEAEGTTLRQALDTAYTRELQDEM